MKFVVEERKGETPRNTNQTPFRSPRNPHGLRETRTRDPRGRRRASNRWRHGVSGTYLLLFSLVFTLPKSSTYTSGTYNPNARGSDACRGKTGCGPEH